MAVLLFEGHGQGPGCTLHQGGIKAVRHDSLQKEQCEGDAVRGISVSLGSAATEIEWHIQDAMFLPCSASGNYFVHGYLSAQRKIAEAKENSWRSTPLLFFVDPMVKGMELLSFDG